MHTAGNNFLGYSLLFSNNSPLSYLLFYMKTEICFLYKGVSYSREPAVKSLQIIRELLVYKRSCFLTCGQRVVETNNNTEYSSPIKGQSKT